MRHLYMLVTAAFVALVTASSVAAEGPHLTIDPPSGDCSLRPIVRGASFPPNTPLELLVGNLPPPGLPDAQPYVQLAVDVQFQSDPSGNFEVKASDQFGRQCLRNPVVRVVIGGGRFPDGHRADLASVSLTFNAPSAPSVGSGVRSSSHPVSTLTGLVLVLLSAALLVLAKGRHRANVLQPPSESLAAAASRSDFP